MTEMQVRQKIVGVMQGWVGRKEANGTHKEIIDIYNAHRPCPGLQGEVHRRLVRRYRLRRRHCRGDDGHHPDGVRMLRHDRAVQEARLLAGE